MPAHQGSYKLVIDREILDGTDETYVSVSAASSSSVHDRYEVIKFIGKGAFANVYLGKDKMNGGAEVAIKEIDIEGASEDERASAAAEIVTLKSLSHKHITAYIESYNVDSKRIHIVLEYAPKGSIRQLYLAKGKLGEAETLHLAGQICRGLEYLHSCGVAHRDVKCANCLLFHGDVVKLSDFGSAKRVDIKSATRGLRGTPHWMPPEVIKGVQLEDGWLRADVWSFGCTLIEMLSGKLPYAEYEVFSAMYRIASGETPNITDLLVSDSLGTLLGRCCSVLPSERPSCTEIIESAVLGGRLGLGLDIDVGDDSSILSIFSSDLEINCGGKGGPKRGPTVVKMGAGSMTNALRVKQSTAGLGLETAGRVAAAPGRKRSGLLLPIQLSSRSSCGSSKIMLPAPQPLRALLGALPAAGSVRQSNPNLPARRVRSAGGPPKKHPAVLPPLTLGAGGRTIKSAPVTSKSLHFLDGLKGNEKYL